MTTITREEAYGQAAARWSSVVALARAQSATLAVEDLADHAGYSPFHFSRLFAARFGLGPGRFLTALRVDAAKHLLLDGEDAVIDVAAAVGFDSLSSFTRRFRSTVGVPPAQLRRLAEKVADRPPRPFAVPAPGAGAVDVGLALPEGFSPRGDPSVWVGWYPQPVPIGLPRAGVLVRGARSVRLALCPCAPFLLGFAVPAQAGVHAQLAPVSPTVAAHPRPVLTAGAVLLDFAAQDAGGPVPLLSALPVLCRS